MTIQNMNRDMASSRLGRLDRARTAETLGYPAKAAANYILGFGPCPWNRGKRKAGVVATTTGA